MEAGSQRLSPLETIGRAHVARREGGGAGRLMTGLACIARLILPVLVLLALGLAALAYGTVPALWLGVLGGSSWLSIGLATLPVGFFTIHLTSRRYGPTYALWQVLGAWTIGAAALLLAQSDPALPASPMPGPFREVASFAAAVFVAQLFAVVVFDRLRGPQWWQAPLFGSVFAGVVLCLIAFPAAYAGTPIDWTGRMASYMAYITATSILLVIPYWMLRGIVPPQSGFGGY